MLKKVLVTGAGGFIGSHLVEHLVAQGFEVTAMVAYNSQGTWEWLEDIPADVRNQIRIVPGDVRDFNSVRTAMKGCEGVLHLAALIAIPYSYQAPQSYVDTNVTGTLNVAQAALDLGVQRVVHISTSEVYGSAQFVPITEDHPLQGQSPYSASKIGADQIALSFHRSFDLPLTVIRPFNTYGPRQSARAVISTIISQIAAGSTQIKLGDTSPTRDFTFVTDTASGMAAALTADTIEGETINLGSNFEISIGDLVTEIGAVMDTEIEIVSERARIRPAKSEVNRLWADTQKADALLNWHPAHAGIEGLRRGLKATADWFTAPENLARYKPDIYNV